MTAKSYDNIITFITDTPASEISISSTSMHMLSTSPIAVMSIYSSTPGSTSTNSSTATPTKNTSGTVMIVSVTDSSANTTIDMTSVTSTTGAVSINGIATTGKETAAV